MNLKPIHYFLGGVALTALIAAAKFAGGTPLDQTFTYQGQLRNAGQLVNGPVDLKISMWDADTGGSQVGSTNTFNAMQLNDGRFACGLNFGNAAFDGSNRWIQVEFRNPAGSGQYQALSPRDKITATPYALYALNGANGVWVYDTNQQSVSVMGKKVGIGTSNPTAALEVVSATGGDDSVKLPAGSVGLAEIMASIPAAVQSGGSPFSVIAPADGFLWIQGQGVSRGYSLGDAGFGRFSINGSDYGPGLLYAASSSAGYLGLLNVVIPVQSGQMYSVVFTPPWTGGGATVQALFVPRMISSP